MGKNKDICNSVGKSAFGKDSIFGNMHLVNAKNVFFGCSFERCTFIHYIEQMHGINYRFLKSFTGTIIDNEKEYTDTFDFLVRDLDGDVEVYLGNLKKELKSRNYLLESDEVLQVPLDNLFDVGYNMLDKYHYSFLSHQPKELM